MYDMLCTSEIVRRYIMEGNNMFKYATKELSQDAFICWCINWIDSDGNSTNIEKI